MAADLTGSELTHYKIKKLLGKGGMGEVYLADDLKLKREVALKVLPNDLSENPNALERFKREALAAASLHHPNICVIHEMGECDGRFFLTMEFCEGQTLERLISTSTLNLEQILHFAVEIAEALDEARKKNIVHRDIKPSNIMIADGNRVKILDFGLAKHVPELDPNSSQAETASRLTADGVAVGTVSYMSPEQALGKFSDHRTDIFALGIVIYQMLSGRLPFTGGTIQELLNSIVNSSPPLITRFNDQVPDGLVRILQKALEKDPERRYQSAKELKIDLEQVRRELSTTSIATKVAVSRSSKRIFAASLIFILMIAGFIYIYRRKSGPISDVAATPAVVALPCQVLGSKELSYLTDAVPSTLSTLLGQVKEIDTKAPPSSLEVNRIRGDLAQISKLYQVDYFLMSSITVEEDRLALNLQVVKPENLRVVWSEHFDGSRDRYNELLEKAANDVHQALVPSSTKSSSPLASRSKAELSYRQGLYYSNRYNHFREKKDFENSLNSLKSAFELDPNFADAPARIAFLYAYMLEEHKDNSTFQTAQTWADHALQIDPHNGIAYAALWNAEFVIGANTHRLIDLALKAIRYSPSEPAGHQFLAMTLYSSGAFRVSREGFQEASRLDPLYFYPLVFAADSFYLEGNTAKALEQVNRMLQMEPEFFIGKWQAGFYLTDLGRLNDAKLTIDQLNHDNRMQPELLDILTLAYLTEIGESQKQEHYFQRILNIARSRNDEFYWACLYAYTFPFLAKHNKLQQTFQLLGVGATHEQYLPYDYLLINPYLKPILSDPKFKEFFSDSKKESEQTLSQLEEARSRGELPHYLEKPLGEAKLLFSKLN